MFDRPIPSARRRVGGYSRGHSGCQYWPTWRSEHAQGFQTWKVFFFFLIHACRPDSNLNSKIVVFIIRQHNHV